MNRFIYGTLVLCCVFNCFSLAAPKPSIVTVRGQWTLDVEFTKLQPIIFDLGGGNQTRYWYTIITLTNNSDDDVDFYPKCEFMTNTFQIKSAGEDVSPAVFQHIKSRHQSRYPFLESLNNAGNRILQGEDNAKDIAVIWSNFDDASDIRLFLTGFSNETAVIDLPTYEGGMSHNQVFLRKTLEISYSIMGDSSSGSNNLEFIDKRWVMR